MKRKRSGRSEDSVLPRLGAGSVPAPCAVAGRLRGWPPPNWCTRIPGPPPRLNTKPGPVSKMPPPPPVHVLTCAVSCHERLQPLVSHLRARRHTERSAKWPASAEKLPEHLLGRDLLLEHGTCPSAAL